MYGIPGTAFFTDLSLLHTHRSTQLRELNRKRLNITVQRLYNPIRSDPNPNSPPEPVLASLVKQWNFLPIYLGRRSDCAGGEQEKRESKRGGQKIQRGGRVVYCGTDRRRELQTAPPLRPRWPRRWHHHKRHSPRKRRRRPLPQIPVAAAVIVAVVVVNMEAPPPERRSAYPCPRGTRYPSQRARRLRSGRSSTPA